MKTIDYIKTWLEEKLPSKRFQHSLGCAEAAQKLAKLFNQDEDKAYIAGLVHDCAKNFDDAYLLDLIKNVIKEGFDLTELKNPKTYHAIAGAYLIQKEFEIFDEDIISAVRNHTIGKTNMTIFEKIIFYLYQQFFLILKSFHFPLKFFSLLIVCHKHIFLLNNY